jgi:3-methylcrotonyl-CoA carboxylase beta subunit
MAASPVPTRELLRSLRPALTRSCTVAARRPRVAPRIAQSAPTAPAATHVVTQQPRRALSTHASTAHAAAVSVLPTAVEPNSAEYKENAAQMDEAVRRVAELHATIAQGGPEKAREKHKARGKMLPRE